MKEMAIRGPSEDEATAPLSDDGWDGDTSCTWCGGDGFAECDDPIQCCDPACDGQIGPCKACNGQGYDQWIW